MSLLGIIPVLVSPMNEDGSPDHKGYHNLLDHIFEHPVGGLWVLGSASEDFLMSFEHRVEIIFSLRLRVCVPGKTTH